MAEVRPDTHVSAAAQDQDCPHIDHGDFTLCDVERARRSAAQDRDCPQCGAYRLALLTIIDRYAEAEGAAFQMKTIAENAIKEADVSDAATVRAPSDEAYVAAINCIRSLWPLRDSGVHQVFLRHAIRVARAWRCVNA